MPQPDRPTLWACQLKNQDTYHTRWFDLGRGHFHRALTGDDQLAHRIPFQGIWTQNSLRGGAREQCTPATQRRDARTLELLGGPRHASRMLHTPNLVREREELGCHVTEELSRAFLCLCPAGTSMGLETDKPGAVPRWTIATTLWG